MKKKEGQASLPTQIPSDKARFNLHDKGSKKPSILQDNDILLPCQICLYNNGCELTWPRCGLMPCE